MHCLQCSELKFLIYSKLFYKKKKSSVPFVFENYLCNRKLNSFCSKLTFRNKKYDKSFCFCMF